MDDNSSLASRNRVSTHTDNGKMVTVFRGHDVLDGQVATRVGEADFSICISKVAMSRSLMLTLMGLVLRADFDSARIKIVIM